MVWRSRGGTPTLVRTKEWDRLQEFIEPTRSGADVLAVVGDPGAGKSSLWRAAVEKAEGQGCRVLRSEPSPTDSELPFAGLSDLILETYSLVRPDLPAPQREALEVALLLRPSGERPSTSYAVGSAVLGVLRALTSSAPVLIAVDDVHWLDEATLEVVSFALRRMPEPARPGVLLTARPDVRPDAGPDPLALTDPPPSRRWRSLSNALDGESLELAPLSAEQLEQMLPPWVSRPQVRDVVRQSLGNPFWAREIAETMRSERGVVPPLASILTERLAASLTDGGTEALNVVSAAGRITLAKAYSALDHRTDAASAVDEVVLAGLVVEADGRLAASHPLIAEAAIDTLPPGRRQALFERLAELSSSPESRAHFLSLASGPRPDVEVAAALDAAAESAHRRAGNVEAAQFASRALELNPAEDTRGRLSRQIRAAELAYVAGELEGALGFVEDLHSERLSTTDLERQLPLLLHVDHFLHGAPSAQRRVAQAAGTVADDPARRAVVFSLASDFAFGLPGRRRDAAIEAIRCAEEVGDDARPSLHRALLNLFTAQVFAGEGMDEEVLRRAEQLEDQIVLPRLHDIADCYRGWQARYVEDLDTSRTALRRAVDRARDAGDEFTLAVFLAHLAATEELAGNYPAASALIAEADAASRWQHWPFLPYRTEPRCDLLIAEGRLDEAWDLAEVGLPDGSGRAAFFKALVRGKVRAWQDDNDAALQWFAQAAGCAEECDFVDPGVRLGVDAWLGEMSVLTDRPDEARAIATRLRDVGERMGRPTWIGVALRIEAQVLALQGDLDGGVAAAQEAVAAHEGSPVRLELVRSLLVLGQTERRRRRRRHARDALRRAKAVAKDMGHRPLTDRVEQELARIAPARSDDELTETEQRVARLVAGGATNRETAATLCVSVRTVETHVGAIYRKLGLKNRSELRQLYGPALPPV